GLRWLYVVVDRARRLISRERARPDVASLQHAHATIFARKLQRDHRAKTFLAFDAHLSAMFTHDALYNHKTEAIPAGLGGVVRLEKSKQVSLLDAAAGVSN